MNSNFGGNITSGLLIALVVLVVIFLICRELFCWYWKINQRVALLTEIRDLLAGKPASTVATLAPAQDTVAKTPPAAAEVAGITAATRTLAERVRDNPRLAVDEKIELLHRLGGKFTWEKGSTCKVVYKGHEHSFPGGKEFGDWLHTRVLPEVL